MLFFFFCGSLPLEQVVAKRYLLKNHEGQVLETPEEMFQRVAHALAEVEKNYGMNAQKIDELARNFYEIMANFEFTPAGRTLANAGGPTRLVSNCIVLHIEDTMESIFGTLRDAALLQKAGSGLGFPLHLMRPAGSLTKVRVREASFLFISHLLWP
jgi:ribonucleoside-diphosphate reductase alpha chain